MKKSHILIVEDENIVSAYLYNVLTNMEYEVTRATGTGEEAISKAQELAPDLVLMDIVLAGSMDGVEAAKIIKDTLDIPVIYVTGNADVDTVKRARETDPYGYVMKPINILDLFSTIDTALHRHNLQKRLKESEEKYRSIVESSSDWIWSIDQNGKYTYSSPKVKDILGYEPYEIIGMSVLSFSPPEEITRLRDFTKEITRSRKPFYALENINIHKDGSRVVLETSGVPFFDEKGAFKGYRGVDRDTTERKRAEEALRENEERFRALVQNLQDIIAIINIEGVVIYENPVTLRTLGYSLLGKNYANLIHPDDLAAAMHDFEEVVKGTNPHVPTMARVRHADGSWIHLEILATNLYDNTTIQGGLFVCRNVTDRMKAQAELRESEARFRVLVESTSDWVWAVDHNMVYTYSSPKVKDLLGYEPHEVLGRTPFDFMPKDGALEIKDRFKEVVASRKPIYALENINLHKDGNIVALETSGVPIFDDSGDFRGYRGIDRDITARKRADEALRQSEERARLIVENATQGIVILKNWRIAFVNKTFQDLIAYSDQVLYAKSLLDFVHPEDRKLVEETYSVILSGQTVPGNLEIRIINDSGNTRWAEITGVQMNWEGSPAFLCFISDVTERRWAEEERRRIEAQIQQMQKLESLGVLAGGIAHDFNNLLMAILGNIDLALLDLPQGSPSGSNLLEAAKASRRAAELCRQMLAYSGKGQFVSEALDLNAIIIDMRHMLEVSITKKAALYFHLSPELPAIEADATQLRQIIMNLVINASDAIVDKSGVITISTGIAECDSSFLSDTWLNEQLPAGTYIYMEVTDTGIGMNEDTLTKIFDPFFTTKFTGRGLGLAAVLGIVRGHKAAIKVCSEKEKGTTFKIFFPSARVPVESLAEEGAADVAWRGSGTVLLADDEEAVRVLGKKILERIGFNVLLAADGQEAIDLFRQNKEGIVCAILDLTMPRMDGEETFRELRQIKRNIKVIMSSGYNEQEITQRFTGKSLSGFIQKPYQMTELSAKLKQILGQ